MRLRIVYGDKVIGLFPNWNSAVIHCKQHVMNGDISIQGLLPTERLGYEVQSDGTVICDSHYIHDKSIEFAKWYNSKPVTSTKSFLFKDATITDVTIPWTIETIAESTFMRCNSLRMVVFEEHSNLTYIGQGAFYGCGLLQSIAIPSKVTEIGNQAFANSGLTTITFKGTKNQWNGIVKGSGWNENIPATKVICTDGEVAL